ncbi:MAG: hypothetical protein QXD66_04380 [Candidatus Nezhaarchaeales archaeon]|nr:MAG: hypothetical protein DSO06_02100 [Candidatus Nezhaarchaeota archaeon WYZ-LMO8]TDA36842.1 MAG: hypothetical protein DSO05_02155 [Candidatus Nezhaarchaeota archaeon WYZ-LMO7]
MVDTRIERRGSSLTWVVGVSCKGLYTVSLTLYKSSSGWRVKRELRLKIKRAEDERTLFIEDYSLPEFQAILEAFQSMTSEIDVDESARRLTLALRASTIINLLVQELGGVSR